MNADCVKYVAGLRFSEDRSKIALIRKNRPVWQKGKLNAIGGRIESGETAKDAMIREFTEETSFRHEDWRLFCTLERSDFAVYFFVGFADLILLSSITDEAIEILDTNCATTRADLIPNLRWIIPLALDECTVTVSASAL